MSWNNHQIHLVLTVGAGLGVSFALLQAVLYFSRHPQFICRKSDLHHGDAVAITRLGGIGLVGAFLSAVLLAVYFVGDRRSLTGNEFSGLTLGSLLMFGLGLWDDFQPLGAKRKLLGQLLIASLVYFMGLGIHKCHLPFLEKIIDLGIFSWPITVIWLVSLTNLINLIDGVDGLAGGICLMLMVLMSFVSDGMPVLNLIMAGMAGGLLGFLILNFPPAKIYMGDGGAYFLGFFIGVATIITSHKGTVTAALTAPLFVLALPILDTSVAILRRGIRGLPVFRPDRRHIHHKLLNMGLSRRKTVMSLYLFTALFLALGLAEFLTQGRNLPVLFGAACLIILLIAGKLSVFREWFAVTRVLGHSLDMRHAIRYALAQTHWLVLEGGRCQNLDSLWQDLVFVAQKNGFHRVRLQLEDGERIWESILPCPDSFHANIPLPGRLPGRLELWACTCLAERNNTPNAKSELPWMPDKKTFHILSDILAEGWTKAAHNWEQQHRLPIRFNTAKSERM